MKDFILLFISFFKIGILTFGGGLAMLPMLKLEVVEKNKWADEEELMNYYAIGQCTPGIIAVNTATFIGYKQKGVLGALVSTVGIITPSVIIITVIAAFIRNFMDYEIVQNMLLGVRIAVAALVTSAVIDLIRKGVKDFAGIIIFALSFLVSACFGVSPVIIVAAAIFLSVVFVLKKKPKGSN